MIDIEIETIKKVKNLWNETFSDKHIFSQSILMCDSVFPLRTLML